MAEDVGEKTEAATPKRRSEAQNRGQFAISRDIASAIIILSGIVAIHLYGEEMLGLATRLTRYCLSTPWMTLDLEQVRIEISRIALIVLGGVWIFFAIVYGAALVVSYLQTGGVHIASEKSYFDLARLNPLSGLQRIFSARGIVRTCLDVAKVAIIGSISYMFLMDRMGAFASLGRLPFPTLGAYTFAESMRFAYYLASILLVLGIADYLYQRYQFEEDLKMTKQQVKDETKDMEGDPQIRSRRRQVQMQLARQRMMKEVPEAEVVITNPTELAVALKYKIEEMDAPVVVAMGAGIFAKRIRELAIQHRIPIIENKPLAQMLFHSAEVGRVIPEDAFIAVAEIMAYVYQLTKKFVPPRPKS